MLCTLKRNTFHELVLAAAKVPTRTLEPFLTQNGFKKILPSMLNPVVKVEVTGGDFHRVNFLYANLVGRSAASPKRRRLSSS